MPRRYETRPTNIYWLVDVRPTTLLKWPRGLPFYCGKTVHSIEKRFAQHTLHALKNPRRRLSRRLFDCTGFVRVELMETVLPDGDWIAREKFLIHTLRMLYPDCVNIADGGQGASGMVHSRQTRAKIKRALRESTVLWQKRRAKRKRLQRVHSDRVDMMRSKLRAIRFGRQEIRKQRVESKLHVENGPG